MDATMGRAKALSTGMNATCPPSRRCNVPARSDLHNGGVNEPETVIRPVSDGDRPLLAWLVAELWGSEVVAVHGNLLRPGELPGFIAERARRVAGLLTYQLVGDTLEIVTLNAIDRNMRHEELADPEINLTLAQEYIQGLLHDERNNLMFFAIAYNGGPGALEHWKSLQASYRDDPLLFLESIPAGESRIFTERVLTNYWIYRLRLNQQTPELDALAAGLWPTYTALDNPEPDSRHVADNQ